MLKKLFCVTLIMAALLVVGNVKVFAQDVWVYTDGRGTEFYVMNETIVNRTKFRNNRNFDVKVKAVRQNSTKVFSVKVHQYSFSENDGMVFYSIDDSKTYPLISDGTAPNELAQRIRSYCLNYLGLNYVVRYDG